MSKECSICKGPCKGEAYHLKMKAAKKTMESKK